MQSETLLWEQPARSARRETPPFPSAALTAEANPSPPFKTSVLTLTVPRGMLPVCCRQDKIPLTRQNVSSAVHTVKGAVTKTRETLGQRIRRLRRQMPPRDGKPLGQKELAALLGVHRS